MHGHKVYKALYYYVPGLGVRHSLVRGHYGHIVNMCKIFKKNCPLSFHLNLRKKPPEYMVIMFIKPFSE